MKAVVKKVMDMKRAKSSWINCASEVIRPLRSVWSQWNDRLTTNWFKVVLHRTLNSKQHTPITVKRIAKTPHREYYECFGIVNDQIYCVCSDPAVCVEDELHIGSNLHVFKGHDLEHCIKTIPLPSVSNIAGISICKRSKRVFLWDSVHLPWQRPVQYLIPDKDGGFEVRCWPAYAPPDDCLESSNVGEVSIQSVSVVDNGTVLRNVYFESHQCNSIISIHTPEGSVIQNIILLDCQIRSNVVLKSNGNFAFAVSILGDNELHFVVREVDHVGCEVDRFEWMHCCDFEMGHMWLFLDESERMICQSGCKKLLFLDSKLCLLEVVEVPAVEEDFFMIEAGFNKTTNEMITMYGGGDHDFLFYKVMLDGEENQMPEQHTRNKLSGSSDEEDIETTEQIKNWATNSKKYVSGTDSFVPLQPVSVETPIGNMDDDSCQVHLTATVMQITSPSPTPATLATIEQSENLMPFPSTSMPNTASISTASRSFPVPACTPSTGSQVQRKRRRIHIASRTNDDELLNAWMASEIKTNSLKEELAKEKIDDLKRRKQVREEFEKEKLEEVKLRKRKLFLEIQQLEHVTN